MTLYWQSCILLDNAHVLAKLPVYVGSPLVRVRVYSLTPATICTYYDSADILELGHLTLGAHLLYVVAGEIPSQP